MIPPKKIEDIIQKHKILEKELSSSEINKKLFAEKSKEYSDLNEIIKEANSYYNYKKNKEELEKLLNDDSSEKEIKDLAISELNELEKNNENNEKLSIFSKKSRKNLLPIQCFRYRWKIFDKYFLAIFSYFHMFFLSSFF